MLAVALLLYIMHPMESYAAVDIRPFEPSGVRTKVQRMRRTVQKMFGVLPGRPGLRMRMN